jgi:hypothetical protein
MNSQKPSDEQQAAKPGLRATFFKMVSAPLAHVALCAVSGWMIVTGLKGLAGFTVNRHTALADLVGIVIVVGLARCFTRKSKAE